MAKLTHLGDNSCVGRVFVAEFDLEVDESQLVGAHLELVVRPQNPRHSDDTRLTINPA